MESFHECSSCFSLVCLNICSLTDFLCILSIFPRRLLVRVARVGAVRAAKNRAHRLQRRIVLCDMQQVASSSTTTAAASSAFAAATNSGAHTSQWNSPPPTHTPSASAASMRPSSALSASGGPAHSQQQEPHHIALLLYDDDDFFASLISRGDVLAIDRLRLVRLVRQDFLRYCHDFNSILCPPPFHCCLLLPLHPP